MAKKPMMNKPKGRNKKPKPSMPMGKATSGGKIPANTGTIAMPRK